jgi:hypothetical protein
MSMRLTSFVGAALLLMLLIGALAVGARQTAESPRQTQQTLLAERLVSSNLEDRLSALQGIRTLGPQNVDVEVRNALMAWVDELNKTVATSQRIGVSVQDLIGHDPEFMLELYRLLAETQDPRAIPVLAKAMGTGTLVPHLADFGEEAAPAVLDVVMDSDAHYTIVEDGLRVLRFMVEGSEERPIGPSTIARIRAAAEQRLTGFQYFTVLWQAIDLAIVLKDPSLREIVDGLSRYEVDVFQRGITDPSLVARTRQRAAERLAGVPARPQREDLREP